MDLGNSYDVYSVSIYSILSDNGNICTKKWFTIFYHISHAKKNMSSENVFLAGAGPGFTGEGKGMPTLRERAPKENFAKFKKISCMNLKRIGP